VVTPKMWASEFKDINSDRAKQFMLELVTKDNKWIDEFEKAGTHDRDRRWREGFFSLFYLFTWLFSSPGVRC
jgi:hypothetical protein